VRASAKIPSGLSIKGQNAIADLTWNAVPLSNLFTKVVDSTLTMFVPYVIASEIEWYWNYTHQLANRAAANPDPA